MKRHDIAVARVGQDGGRLVLQFKGRLPLRPAEVWRHLPISGPSTGSLGCADPTVHWEVAGVDPGSRVAFTAWIDAEDIEAAAGVGAEYHLHFRRLMRELDAGAVRWADNLDRDSLVDQYDAAFAAVLANTD